MSQQFREREDGTLSVRPTTIGRLGVMSLGLTLLATVGSLCCFSQVGLLMGLVAMVGGFGCFFVSREAGSKRDLIVGILGMVTGFLIVGYSIYGMQLDAEGQNKGLGITDQIIQMGGPPKLFEDKSPKSTRTTPQAPLPPVEKTLPEPTRPATKSKDSEEQP